MEKKMTAEEMQALVAEMRDEIAALKAAFADRVEADEKRPAQTSEIRQLFEEGFSKLSDAVRPVLDEADRKLGEPAREMAEKVEEKISAYPFTSIAVALGVGVVAGRILDALGRPTYTGRN